MASKDWGSQTSHQNSLPSNKTLYFGNSLTRYLFNIAKLQKPLYFFYIFVSNFTNTLSQTNFFFYDTEEKSKEWRVRE